MDSNNEMPWGYPDDLPPIFTMERVAQAIILISGALAIWMTQCGDAGAMRWAPVIGLAGQPFWLVETYKKKQVGMFFLSCFVTVSWMVGVVKLAVL